jgi:uroporphyrinogen decarboxylase
MKCTILDIKSHSVYTHHPIPNPEPTTVMPLASEPPPWHNSPLMKAVRGEPAERVPIWLMRQAGRYMAEYRAVRQRVSFLDLCKNPQLCAEVALTAVDRLGVDAAIVFSDLLLILEPLGLELQYTASDGPQIGNPIRRPQDVDRLAELTDVGSLEFVVEAVRQTRAGLSEQLPLIGFAGAPFTLAAYAVEGGSSRDYRRVKSLMYEDAGAFDALLRRLARAVVVYLNAQIDAGAQVVQLFDSWVGCLGVDDYRRHVLPHSRAVVEAVSPRAAVIHFATGNPALLPLLGEAGRAVIGIDWRVRLDDAWRMVGYDKAVQGNLDPVVLLSNPAEIRRRVSEILNQAAGRDGHIFNLGHGIVPQTPVENAVALVEAVHELGRA